MVLPAPLGPHSTANSPLPIRKLTSESAGTFTGPTLKTFDTR